MTLAAYNKMRLFRPAAVGLLAGCAWFAATTFAAPVSALAQSTSAASAQQAQPSDATVQTGVLSAIQADGSLRGQPISASVAKGVVTLSGTVQTQAQAERAVNDAVSVSGVNGILNQLKIAHPGAGKPSAGIAAQSAANQLNSQSQTTPAMAQLAPAQTQMQTSAPAPPPDTQQPQQTQQNAYPPQQPAYSPQQNNAYRQPYYGNSRSPYNQQGYEGQQQPEVPYYATSTTPVTIPSGTFLLVRLVQPLDSAQTQVGTYFQATAGNDVYENGVLAIPRGAELTGQVVEVKHGGRFGGSAEMRLRLTSVNLAGKVFPLTSNVWSNKGPNKAERTAGNTAGGAVLGAIIGGLIGGGGGAAVGAAAGGVGGLAASGATHGPRIYLPAETALNFRLTAPVAVVPVPWQEAQRLATSAPRPVLVRRPPRPVYVAPPPYYSPYYAPY